MIEKGQLIIPEARIETTTLCNANCVVCPRHKMKRSKALTMPMNGYIEIVRQLRWLGAKMIVLCGLGEPLCDRYIIERIRCLTAYQLESFITTNAQLLNEETTIKLMESGLTHIRFSVHALLPHQYNRVHKNCDYFTVMNNIYNFITVNDSIKTHVSVIPLHGEKVEDIRHYWEDCMGVDYLEIWEPHNWINALDYRPLTKERKKTCGRVNQGPIEITIDRKLRGCCFDWDGDLTFGDARSIEKSIKEDPEFAKLQRAHRTGNYEGLVCQTCDQRNVGDKPLLYSSRDATCEVGKTSTGKNKI